jgi:membrane protease YdiL (CAAX protease family)
VRLTANWHVGSPQVAGSPAPAGTGTSSWARAAAAGGVLLVGVLYASGELRFLALVGPVLILLAAGTSYRPPPGVLIRRPRSGRWCAEHTIVAVAALSISASALSPSVPATVPIALTALVLARRGWCGPVRSTATRAFTAGLLWGVPAAAAAATWSMLHRGVVLLALPALLTGDALLPLIAFVVAGSLVNALAEEALWRGALPLLLRSTGLTWWPTTLLLSASFGLTHLSSIPGGIIGVALTTAFGVVAAVLVRRTGRLLPAVTAHFFADLALLGILLLP